MTLLIKKLCVASTKSEQNSTAYCQTLVFIEKGEEVTCVTKSEQKRGGYSLLLHVMPHLPHDSLSSISQVAAKEIKNKKVGFRMSQRNKKPKCK